MAAGVHSYGPTCAFYEEEPDKPLPHGSDPPRARAQFFYISSLPIDDPLSPLPPIQIEDASNHPPKPFSARDNAALEEAWAQFQGTTKAASKDQLEAVLHTTEGVFSFPKFKDGVKSPPLTTSAQEPSPIEFQAEELRSTSTPFSREGHDTLRTSSTSSRNRTQTDSQKTREEEKLARSSSKSMLDSGNEDRPKELEAATDGTAESESSENSLDQSQLMLNQTLSRSTSLSKPVDVDELQEGNLDDKSSNLEQSKQRRLISPFRSKDREEKKNKMVSPPQLPPLAKGAEERSDQPSVTSTSFISGRPFARAPSRRNVAQVAANGTLNITAFSDDSDVSENSEINQNGSSSRPKKISHKGNKKSVFVPVGVSKLHLVEMPNLEMKPIYWNPINDISSVVRATWFYKASMLPVPVEVANRLEIGYEYIQPYVESYQEELQACIDNGAAAELKVVHKLWADENKISRPSTGINSKQENVQLMSEDKVDIVLPVSQTNVAVDPRKRPPKRLFETHSVIYIDQTNAQILRPSLLPSVQQNRRPLNSVRKGRQIGVAVVRGFDRNAWTKLYPGPKLDARNAHAKVGAFMSQSGDATTRTRRMSCTTCDHEAKKPKVKDLVLVIHGIGQKLSERVDSYHFTHAINGLRREFNVELSSESVKGTLSDETGIMVLPVNWRLTVDFDEDNKQVKTAGERNNYHLSDITPDTLQGVRSLISDVMLDIPYYLSHHKQKMTSAVVREANRVYRLWCRNNPGFQEHGRVHLIAHSLGSVMAMEILSQQPTELPKGLKLDTPEPKEDMFEFDTKNLFCCGSPSGFFLLLNGASLVPRKGRRKPGMEIEDSAPGLASHQGVYGCLSVDNVYNICHRNDPVAYLMNASVDRDYAASLRPMIIPSATVGFFSRVGNSLNWASVPKSDAYSTVVATARPPMQQMPSTVELDTHNFTQEEMAEKRMYLLNDNGQIDFYLQSGGGPLEIQYLNMLSAHSSYWISQDFVRYLVVEIGRKAGRENTVPVLRAVKKREYKRGNIAG